MTFNDTPQGTTHHDNDACYKCLDCEGHYLIRSAWGKCKDCILKMTKRWDKDLQEQYEFKEVRDNNDLTNI